MSELISGKEAVQSFINGEQVEFLDKTGQWRTMLDNTILKVFLDHTEFRLKPRTITINGIEVPAPFEPKAGERAFYIKAFGNYDSLVFDWQSNDFGYWRTEEEIRQVVAALRKCLEVPNEHAR